MAETLVVAPLSPATDTFTAMGSNAHVIVLADSVQQALELVQLARTTVDGLERLWSRFLAHSDIGRINSMPGVPVRVDALSIDLVARSVDAWEQTAGVFDPTIGRSMRCAGYDRPLDQMAPFVHSSAAAAPSPRGIEIHRSASTIAVPPGVLLDLGGIGKGAAADHAVDVVLDAGASGAMVNLGGDLRAGGVAPENGWLVQLECPGSEGQASIRIASGAVCTSSTVKRRWNTSDGERHHILDAVTGASVDSDICSATVIGATAAQCEVLATTSIAIGRSAATRFLETHHTSGVLVDEQGQLHDVGMIGAYR